MESTPYAGTPEHMRSAGNIRVPRLPWVASEQYGMRFILSQDNEIIIRADHLPMGILRDMACAANIRAENYEIRSVIAESIETLRECQIEAEGYFDPKTANAIDAVITSLSREIT